MTSKIKQITSTKQLINTARKSGVRIFATVKITPDDEICVEVKKADFIYQLLPWEEDNCNCNLTAIINKDGDILI